MHAVAHALERGLARRAHVEAQPRLARHLVRRAGQRADAPDGRDGAGLGERELVRGEHRAGGGHERVAATGHRRGARVVGDAAQRAAPALARGQRRRDRRAERARRRAADPARRAPRSRRPRAAGTPVRHAASRRVTPRSAARSRRTLPSGSVRASTSSTSISPHERARAEDRRAEARALLVDHRADRERPPRATGAARGLDRDEPGHDAERAVERAAVGDRVDVRADRVERALLPARLDRPEVAGRVLRDLQPERRRRSCGTSRARRPPPAPRPCGSSRRARGRSPPARRRGAGRGRRRSRDDRLLGRAGQLHRGRPAPIR